MKIRKLVLLLSGVYLALNTITIAHAAVKIADQAAITASPLPHPSAMLEVDSTEKGFLLPRMTTAERDAIANPANGLVIFNTDVQCINTANLVLNAISWHDYCLSNRLMVDASIAEPFVSHDPSVFANSDVAGNLPNMQDNQGQPWAVPYTSVPSATSKDVNYSPGGVPVWDNSTWSFKAPISGMYDIQASYGNRRCNPGGIGDTSVPNPWVPGAFISAESAQLISISKPISESDWDNIINNTGFPGMQNIWLSRPFWGRNIVAANGCSVPNIVSSRDEVLLEAGERIVILNRYRNAPYDVSIWNYDNNYINRLVITYLASDPNQ